MTPGSRRGEIGEPHPFCVCEPHKTYCDFGKVTPGCTKQSPDEEIEHLRDRISFLEGVLRDMGATVDRTLPE